MTRRDTFLCLYDYRFAIEDDVRYVPRLYQETVLLLAVPAKLRSGGRIRITSRIAFLE